MRRRSSPLLGMSIGLAVWMMMDCRTHATPTEVRPPATPANAEADELTLEQKALLEFLQNDGMAALICYGGYVIVPPPPPTGVNNPPPDNTGGNPPPPDGGNPPPPDDNFPPPNDNNPPPDNTGGNPPPGPEDEVPFPPEEPFPEHLPEPGSIVLGLVGVGVTSLSYLRRRGRGKHTEQP